MERNLPSGQVNNLQHCPKHPHLTIKCVEVEVKVIIVKNVTHDIKQISIILLSTLINEEFNKGLVNARKCSWFIQVYTTVLQKLTKIPVQGISSKL